MSRDSPTRPRRLGPLRGTLLSLVILLGLAALGEVLVRVLTDTHPPLLVVDARVGRRYDAGFRGVIHDPESGRSHEVSFNRDGFRFPDVPYEAPPGTHRVAVVGDSMIAALQVPRQETAVALAEAELNRGTERWEVLNFGVSGSGTVQQHVVVDECVRPYAPELVLCVFFVGNDFGDNSPELTQRTRMYFDLSEEGELLRRPFPSLKTRWTEALNRYSRLYVWQKELTANLARGRRWGKELTTLEERHAWHGEGVRPSELVFLQEPEGAALRAWELTRAALAAMARDVASWGGELRLALLPSSQLVHEEEFDYLLSVAGPNSGRLSQDQPRRALSGIAEELGLRFVDWTPSFRAAAPSRSELCREEWLFLNGNGHLNEAGNELVGHLIADEASD